eukprot:SAG11_NODE_4717_length_1794_cov_3.004130_2_plen_55_part_00
MEEYADLEPAKIGYVAGQDRIVYDYHKAISILMKQHSCSRGGRINRILRREADN